MNKEDAQLNLSQREEKILKFWEENQIFAKTLKKTKNGKPFIFYEGPPFANGHPGIHHVEARVLKDVFLRFKTMQGYFVRRKAGWDTHGLPAELGVEKELGLKNKRDIERYGIGPFNQKCRESVWKYKDEWEAFTKRIGFWLDLDNPYITYETSYIESLWFIIKRFWQDKNLYKDYKIIPWCSRCGTGLSSHELGQPGAYRKVKDPSVFVKFPIKGRKNEYLLVWTTTPWTLPGNIAVAVNQKVAYKKFGIKNQESRSKNQESGIKNQEAGIEYLWSANTPPVQEGFTVESMETVPGSILVGLEYEAPYPQKNIPYKVIAGDFVTTEDGTGMVHIAPAFGEDDMNVAKKEFGKNYPILHTVTSEGKIAKGIVGEGAFVKEADKTITVDLDKRGLLLKLRWHEHDYPFCWRCDTPLIYLARESWWVKKPVARLIANNKKINWHPDYLRDGRFGEWLKEPKDWAFSRERYWGVPLPIWQCKKCDAVEVIGSLIELQDKILQSRNSYILIRHGQAESNMLGKIDDTLTTYHLTEIGKKQVKATVKKFKKAKIDTIYASPILRAKETAEIIAKELGIKINYDDRLQEIHLGELGGKPVQEYHNNFPTIAEKLKERPKDGESLRDLRARIMSFIREIDAKHGGKNILIVSHEYPLWILATAGAGMDENGIVKVKQKRGKDFLKNAEIMRFKFKKMPYSHTGEVDLHRPFIDEMMWQCICGGTMQRVSEVCDVWFDSGAMPFAEDHYPFNSLKFEASAQKKIGKPEFFPAEFICEGVDQTRGWFYTLLTVSTLLGFESPYKNVVSLGHVLDKNGQKMSKSKGNAVEPNALIAKYGVDAVRWYFYTVNAPWDQKSFDEKDVAERLRGFLNTFWNSLLLLETYAPKRIKNQEARSGKQESVNILDRWILSRLQDVIQIVTVSLDSYNPVEAARCIEKFLITEFSQWYLRRSRRRLQKPETKKELAEASAVSAHALLELAKLSAPFTPFFSEIIFQRLRERAGIKEQSVHLVEWPKAEKKLRNQILELEMAEALKIAEAALKQRAEHGIKVRQPLASFSAPLRQFKFPEILEIAKDEINVKNLIQGEDYNLDTVITKELKEEGMVREFIRNIQEMRKDGGFLPKNVIEIAVLADSAFQKIIAHWSVFIKKEVGAKTISITDMKHIKVKREIKIDGKNISIAITHA